MIAVLQRAVVLLSFRRCEWYRCHGGNGVGVRHDREEAVTNGSRFVLWDRWRSVCALHLDDSSWSRYGRTRCPECGADVWSVAWSRHMKAEHPDLVEAFGRVVEVGS